jgi:hypothetical protein
VRPPRTKGILLGALFVAAASLAIPLSASAAQIETFVSCSDAAPIPSHVCKVGDSPGAFFESDEDVEYDVCAEFPDGEELCLEDQEAEGGVLFVNSLTTNLPGNHLVTWFVEDVEVGSWDFRMEPLPPPPVLAPPALPPSVAPVGPSAACLKARQRVRKLKTALRKAGPEQKVKIRGKLGSARTAAKRAC